MLDLIRILRLRQTLLVNIIRSDLRKNLLKWIFLILLAIIFAVGDFAFFYRIISYMKNLPLDVGQILIPQLLSIILLTFFSMLLFSNVITAISTLFLSSELELLIATPLKNISIFQSKFIQTAINSSWMLIIFGIPIFTAYGVVFHASILYYLVQFIVFIPFIIIPSGIGITFTIMLMFFFPAKKTHQILTVLALVLGACLVMYLRFLKPEVLLGKDVPDNVIIQFVENLKIPDYPFLPTNWAANAFIHSAVDDWGHSFIYIFYLWGIALMSLCICNWTAKRTYFKVWTSAKISMSRSRPHMMYGFKWLNNLFSNGLCRIVKTIPMPFARQKTGLLIKDFKLFFRDPAQWSQLFLLGALVIVYIFNIRNLPLDTIYLTNLISIMNIGLAGVVISAVAVRFVFPSTSLEGRYIWIIKSAPLKGSKFLWEKFWINLIPLLALSEILVILSNIFLGVDQYVMTVSIVSIFLITIGLVGMGVGMGALYPVLKYENVAEIAISTGGILYMILSFSYIGAVVILGARPVYVHFYKTVLFRNIEGGITVYICYALICILTALVTFVPMYMGIKAFNKIEI